MWEEKMWLELLAFDCWLIRIVSSKQIGSVLDLLRLIAACLDVILVCSCGANCLVTLVALARYAIVSRY